MNKPNSPLTKHAQDVYDFITKNNNANRKQLFTIHSVDKETFFEGADDLQFDIKSIFDEFVQKGVISSYDIMTDENNGYNALISYVC